MSLTFTAELIPADGYAASCGCAGATEQAERFTTFDLAHAAAQAANLGPRAALSGCELPDVCPDYPLYAHVVHDEPAPHVNLHNANAVRLLELLGLQCVEDRPADAEAFDSEPAGSVEPSALAVPLLSVDAYGQMDAHAFLGRVLIAEALTPADAGTEGTWHGRHFTGGRSAGHLQRRFHDLRELSAWCAARGRRVSWS
jgi:hypothetical protein